ncbi:hypothetical protein Tco_1325489, partial [Tanacetum coccineum]
EELIVVLTALEPTAAKFGPRKSSTNSKGEEFLTELQNLKAQENEAYSTSILEDTPEILAFRKKLDEPAQKHLREIVLEETPQTKRTKKQIREEQASLAEIARIQAEEEAENARREELKRQDELAAKRLQEELELS